MAAASTVPEVQAIKDMIITAFFFLLLPGEYTGTKSDITPFCLSDVTFSVGRTVFYIFITTDSELDAVVFVILVFTTHKNGARGDKIGHGSTGDPLLCPKESLRRRVDHIRQHGAPANNPFACFKMPMGR